MKALTLHAPWAWAICYLGKDVENRTCKPPAGMVGQRIAIHAGSPAQWTRDNIKALLAAQEVSAKCFADVLARRTAIHRAFRSECASIAERDRFCSAIVATAVISDVRKPQDTDDGWHLAGQYGWVLTDVQVLPVPVKCKGALGLWTVPAEIEAQMETRG